MSAQFNILTGQSTFPLFDKIVNIELLREIPAVTTGPVQSDFIMTPRVGRKPTISISGKIRNTTDLSDINVKVTNLFTGETPLDAYKYLKVHAGYSGSLGAVIEGEILYAYQENPGPDGVTCFPMVVGKFTNWTNVMGSLQWPAGTSVRTVLEQLASLLGLTLQYNLPSGLITKANWSFNGLVSQFVSMICQALPIPVYIYPNGQFLIAYESNSGTGIEHVIQYVTVAPRHEAYGFNLMAPWNPSIRPGDTLVIDAKYMRQTYGGAVARQGSTRFTVITIGFDFSTTGDTNMMVVQAVEQT